MIIIQNFYYGRRFYKFNLNLTKFISLQIEKDRHKAYLFLCFGFSIVFYLFDIVNVIYYVLVDFFFSLIIDDLVLFEYIVSFTVYRNN